MELAKKLNNPVASLISVPLQFNYDTGFGPKDADKLTLNVQPVIPVSINEDWNVIVRTIVPVVYQESIADGIDSKFGLGDTLQSFFFSPKAADVGRMDLGRRSRSSSGRPRRMTPWARRNGARVRPG